MRRRALFLLLLAALNGCRCGDQPTTSQPTNSDASDSSLIDGPPSQDAEITAALPPACEGKSLSLIQSVTDERCAIPHEQWASLTPPTGIRPKAERAAPGMTVVFSLTNSGKTTVDLPLRYQADRAQLSVVAEDKDRVLYELAPPTLLDSPSDGGTDDITDPEKLRSIRQNAILRDGGKSRIHSARIRLAPQGTISARYLVSPTIEKRIAPPCDACTSPPHLPKGHYTLHLGQLFIDLGPELASVEIDVP